MGASDLDCEVMVKGKGWVTFFCQRSLRQGKGESEKDAKSNTKKIRQKKRGTRGER